MISGKLKSFICSKKIRRALSSNGLNDRGFSGKAGLIIDAENLEEKCKLADFYESAGLKKENFSVVVCGSRKNLPEDLAAIVLDPKEITITGEFRSDEIRSFAEENFDFVICYLSKTSIASALLAAVAKSKIRIGNKPDEYGIYDVEIDSNKVEVFQQEALKYLRILKK